MTTPAIAKKNNTRSNNLSSFRRDPIAFLRQMAKEQGDWATFPIGPYPCVLINDPQAIFDLLVTNSKNVEKGPGLLRTGPLLGDGLLTADTATHGRRRSRVQPAFSRAMILGYATAMVECAQTMSGCWKRGDTLDIHREMNRLTLGIIGETLFKADLDEEAGEVGEALTTALYSLYDRLRPQAASNEQRSAAREAFPRAQARLQHIVDRLVSERRDSGTPDDEDKSLIALLLREDAGDGDLALTETQIRDEAMTFFLAGHESVANALTWTWYALSQSPECAAQFYGELDEALGGQPPCYDDLARLPYTRRLLMESMRLYPPAWMVSRRAHTDCEVGGHSLPAGTIAIAAQCVTHSDPRYYANPNGFDPDRWLTQRAMPRRSLTYFPFGAGPRACIGEQFAWTELILLLAALGQRWKLDLAPGHPVEMEPIVTLRPKFGLQMTLRARF